MPGRPPGRGDKKAGGKRPPKTREESISRNLSYLLRHNAEAEGVHVDEGGWAVVADVVSVVDLIPKNLKEFRTVLCGFSVSNFELFSCYEKEMQLLCSCMISNVIIFGFG